MSVRSYLSQLFQKNTPENTARYEIEFTAYGVRFFSALHEVCTAGTGPEILQLQYVTLKMLCEAGEASETPDGFFLPDKLATRLSNDDRLLLGLPAPWPGTFELQTHHVTSSPSFTVELLLCSSGIRKTNRYILSGPHLTVEGRSYLPDEAQILALDAVETHKKETEKSEAQNLITLKTLQVAQKHGLPIDLQHFDANTFPIEQPERISVTATECVDGSLRLVPHFGTKDTPEEIEKRLGQIDIEQHPAMRIGKRIILLDKKRLEGIQEILSNREIPAKEREQFLKTPEAFLNASLVDLENGLSIRVHGAELFQQAYFGETDAQSRSWFGDPDKEPEVLFLGSITPYLSGTKDFTDLEESVSKALSQGAHSAEFKQKQILLPATPDDTRRELEKIKTHVSDHDVATPQSQKPTPQESTQNVTVKIDLNDEELGENFALDPQKTSSYYQGPICQNGCKFTPYPYQERGIRWILGLAEPTIISPNESQFHGALLADDMGLGKTFMTLASLQIFIETMRNAGTVKPTLIVAPVVLLENWKNEIERVFEQSPFRDIVMLQAQGDLPHFRQDGAGRESIQKTDSPLTAIRYSLKIGRKFGNHRLDMPGRLVLTNYDTLRDYQFSLCMVDWGMVIFDEAQDIKNPNAMKSRAAKGLNALFRLAVTGTPVENELRDFWSIFDTVSPGQLGSYKDFRTQYVAPILQASPDDKTQTRVTIGKKLRSKVGDYMLRRTKEECLDCLPQKIIHNGATSSCFSTTMQDTQLQKYDAVVSAVVAAKASGNSSLIQQILLPSLKKLRDVSLHPDLLDGGIPPLGKDQAEHDKILRKSGKISIMLDILHEIQARDEKVIIFLTNKRLQKYLAVTLGFLFGHPIDVINGDTKSVRGRSSKGTPTRTEIIKNFEDQKGFRIIIMSPLAAGVGLTVTGANNVIHLERHWNPAKEAQATDRVYRIGAKKDVHVYIPILRHPNLESFDCNLNELLSNKTELKDAIISPQEIAPNDFDTAKLFGESMPVQVSITPDWLDSIGWELFEALTACLWAKEFHGETFLTPMSGDFGADVVGISDSHNALIQCKYTKSIDDYKILLEPHSAKPEYESRLHKNFDQLFLCTAASHISAKAQKKAQTFNVTIWDKKTIKQLITKHKPTYEEIQKIQIRERLSFSIQ